MMDCREVKPLLPLWIGQDLPDTATASDVARHLENCPECNRHRLGLQSSIDVLQSLSAETLSDESVRGNLWPKLMTRISEWENRRQEHRFNGWIPASVMAVAVALMVAVSIPSLHEEFFGAQSESTNGSELFAISPELQFDGDANVDRPAGNGLLNRQPRLGVPVVYKPEQW